MNLQKKLTPLMITDIQGFSKTSSVAEIKDFLENKYTVKLDYMTIYNQFRAFCPKFGTYDCQNFLNYLVKEEASFRTVISEQNQSLTKLLFSTKLMKKNYQIYGDILLCDTTYQTNFYAAPLVVFSGLDSNYRNVLYAIGIINDEKTTTYEWLIEQFLDIMGQKAPDLIISDMDLALTSAIKAKLPTTKHRLCAWHISRSLKRNFGYINQDNEEIKKKILGLPYYFSKTNFDSAVKEIESFLKNEKLEKSQRYLTNLLEKKDQWARAYYPLAFDADISTISRVESWNYCIKRYLHSKCEISDIIQFISETEDCYFYKELKASKGVASLLEYDSLLRNLKEALPSKIYTKHLIQYALGRRDYIKLNLLDENSEFQVQFHDNKNSEDIFINEIDLDSPKTIYKVKFGDKIDCSCGFFESTGMVCRHIFFICVTENIKDISKLRISNRWPVSLEGPSEKIFAPFQNQ